MNQFSIEMNFDAMPSVRCRMLTADGISTFQKRRERLDSRKDVVESRQSRKLFHLEQIKNKIFWANCYWVTKTFEMSQRILDFLLFFAQKLKCLFPIRFFKLSYNAAKICEHSKLSSSIIEIGLNSKKQHITFARRHLSKTCLFYKWHQLLLLQLPIFASSVKKSTRKSLLKRPLLSLG